eukprot:NODE_2762_length_646_cov_44.234506_g2289_i0.p1 GENE.NODE_2762_length_646_cov_44.234506_g2289_i0~~NODE_2762_length_646_cov_44.234506_g2289_i0.p1  ORF type:complete len:115 (+),score=7.39 NODE_2762_length_646_cov_44.234506_g2289_i0:114-458(+)
MTILQAYTTDVHLPVGMSNDPCTIFVALGTSQYDCAEPYTHHVPRPYSPVPLAPSKYSPSPTSVLKPSLSLYSSSWCFLARHPILPTSTFIPWLYTRYTIMIINTFNVFALNNT